jgi:hypothetical protein
MTHRNPVSYVENAFYDSEQVDENDLTVEQNHNDGNVTALINNQVGSGVLPGSLVPNVLFDSLLVSGLLDGTVVNVQHQPSDTNFGNQLEITLSGSTAAGKRAVKLAIIGLDFQGNLQYETFTFTLNETQYTKKHYTNVLVLLFNDFIGPVGKSFNLGGRVLIQEASPFTVSRDPISVSQDVQPNLFFRDFFVVGYATLTNLLAAALPLYNVDNLNINIGYKENLILAANDVTTQIGEKFQATTNNIQKITLLLSVQNTATGQATNLNWQGDLVISIYPLQSTVDCPTTLLPDLAIDFPPSNVPLAQLSFNIGSLEALGVLLDGNPQPIDFIFSNTQVASGNVIIPGQYYAVTLKRSGAANQCDILITAGSNQSSTSRVTTFTGSIWVDNTEDDLWYRVYGDAVKVSDGQAYETGHGIILPKTTQNTITNITTDYSLDVISFATDELFSVVLSSQLQSSGSVQDQRTGNPVFTRQQFVPNVQLLNSIDTANLEAASEPLIIGLVEDKNQKSFNASTANILASLHSWNFVGNTFVIKIIDDITDGYRYDPNVNALVSNLLQGDFTDAKIIPDISNPSAYYRIASAELCSMIYGDVDGNGIVDSNDLTLLNTLLGANLNASPPLNSQITTNGFTTTVVNGYEALANPFATASGLTWQLVNPNTTVVVASGVDGALLPNPNNLSLATFESISTNFSLISNLVGLQLVIYGASNQANNGEFNITSLDIASNNLIDIQKLYITPTSMGQILRADIDGDFDIDSNDGYLLQQYIYRAPPFPPSSLPSTKIGTQFNVLQIVVEPFLYQDAADSIPDRTDDYPANAVNRNASIHAIQDIFINDGYKNDGYLQNHNFLNFPVQFQITKQLSWEPWLISTNGDARFVPTIFSSLTGFSTNQCSNTGVSCEYYSDPPEFDPGRIDVFVPNNLIMGLGGQIVQPDGYYFKVDLETHTITLEIPNTSFGTENSINIFDVFVSDYTGTGQTRYGYPAARYGDCSTVQPNDILQNKVRFAVAIQSFTPALDGYTNDGYFGIIDNPGPGVYIDPNSGILRLDFAYIHTDSVLLSLTTKVLITVFLKKAGFNNAPLFVDQLSVSNILGLPPATNTG